jgi:hypothetical protein
MDTHRFFAQALKTFGSQSGWLLRCVILKTTTTG